MILIRIMWVTHEIEANISKSVTFASISFINIFLGFLTDIPLIISLLHDILNFQLAILLWDGSIPKKSIFVIFGMSTNP